MKVRDAFLLSRRCLGVIAGLMLVSVSGLARAQSVLDRLSGFDEARATAVAPWFEEPTNEAMATEAAKLLYQVNRLANGGLVAPESEPGQVPRLGQIVSVRGNAKSIESWSLPPTLADVLEFKTVYRIEIVEEGGLKTWRVITTNIPATWLRDKTPAEFRATSASGVLIRTEGESLPAVIAAPSLSWLATAGADIPVDWAWLGSLGFDVSLFDGVRSRDRQELKTADSPAFYPLLRISDSFGDLPASQAPASQTPASQTPASQTPASQTPSGSEVALPVPANIPAAELLRKSSQLVGRFVRLDLQTVRITRITVTEDVTKQRLGSDHYFQIDALGDLGNVVIKIESKEGEDALFENRYPVSIATRTLPKFLVDAMNEGSEGATTEVAMVSRPVVVEGIFYRLWSYESDFMKQHGGGNQFGPLVLASRISPVGEATSGGSGASSLGKYIAGFAILGIAAVALGALYASRRDSAAKKRSRRALPDQLGE